MIHLTRQGDRFYVIDTAPNHEVIKTSQTTGLTTRKAAIKNIRSSAKLYTDGDYAVLVQDNTGKQPRMIMVTPSSVIPMSSMKPGRAYEPKRLKRRPILK